MSFAIVIFGLIMIIMIHEGGHFLAARAVGIRVTKYYLFFPPKLFSFKRGDVEYGVGAIPLGGYVKLPGMFEPLCSDIVYRVEHSVEQVCAGIDSETEQDSLRAAWRMVGSAHTAEMLDLRVRDLHRAIATTLSAHPVPAGSRSSEPAQAWCRSIEGFLNRLDGVLDDLHPKAYWRAPVYKRMIVLAAGPGVNILLGFVVLFITAMLLTPVNNVTWNIAKVSKNSPAAQAGIVNNSRIVSWNGLKPGTSEADVVRFSKVVKKSVGYPIDLVVRHDGVNSSAHLVPRPLTKGGKSYVGITSGVTLKFDHYQHHGVIKSLNIAGRDTGAIITGTLTGLKQLVQPKHFNEVHGIVGIVKISPMYEQARALLPYLGAMSLVIAVFNLLPILPLDGGHLALGVAEWLRRGRPVSRMVMERASMFGLVLMLGLFAIGLRNDLGFGG